MEFNFLVILVKTPAEDTFSRQKQIKQSIEMHEVRFFLALALE
ncbi:Uncharacterised protein [Burkholderia pseudomallei]|nr:Uncharacterised protein [Burkholderia pseudomallei]CAJ9356370.1 Uncharacterised protein [Burkholderia pseudomallei]CFK62783.1 Uncharacterised protein [Burkholderia pseudomallei]CFT65090.1 Uncharacterised protein [Burkholderia pseudomallei]VBO50493.1 Uncharacterised protein [Burkholderia pseudomallei]